MGNSVNGDWINMDARGKDKAAYITLRSILDTKIFLIGVFILTVGLAYALGIGGLIAGLGIAVMLLALIEPAD